MCAVNAEDLSVLEDVFMRIWKGFYRYIKYFFPLQANTGYKQLCVLLIDNVGPGRALGCTLIIALM